MFWLFCFFVCPSVSQQDYLQGNEQTCVHETFIRGVSRFKKQSNISWRSCGLRYRHRIRIEIRATPAKFAGSDILSSIIFYWCTTTTLLQDVQLMI